MKFILFVLLIGILTASLECVLPWWVIAVIPFLVSLAMNMKGGISFIAGFFGVGAFWFFTALLRDIPNEHILSKKIAIVLHLSDYGLLLFVVATLGGVIGGLSALAGSLMRPLKRSNYIV